MLTVLDFLFVLLSFITGVVRFLGWSISYTQVQDVTKHEAVQLIMCGQIRSLFSLLIIKRNQNLFQHETQKQAGKRGIRLITQAAGTQYVPVELRAEFAEQFMVASNGKQLQWEMATNITPVFLKRQQRESKKPHNRTSDFCTGQISRGCNK